MADIEGGYPKLWVWTKRSKEMFEQKMPDVSYFCAGSPFLYLLKTIRFQQTSLENRAGSIVFPAHCSHLVEILFDYEEYAHLLNALPKEYHPISVCMHYTDLAKDRHVPFQNAGFEVISAGMNRNDSAFLYNFVRLASAKRYAFSNQRTTALLYCAFLGLNSFLLGPQLTRINRGNKHVNGNAFVEPSQAVIDAWAESFRFPRADTRRQRLFAESELGVDCLRSASVLRRRILSAALSRSYFSLIRRRSTQYVRDQVRRIASSVSSA